MKRHNVILESNVEPKDHNVLWLQGNKLKKFGNTGWENIIEGDIVTTDRIENGAVTTDKIATDAFDSTLSKSKKIAPADAVGLRIAEATKLPDDEDITSVNNLLKFADKDYLPTSYSGLGRVYLRKNLVGGKNVLTQDMISNENTIYIIQYDYDLNGATITIPQGSVLNFEGGQLKNGTLNSTNLNIVSETKCFDNIKFSGRCCYNNIIKAKWFIAKYPSSISDKSIDNTEELKSAILCGVQNIEIPRKYIHITETINIDKAINLLAEKDITFEPRLVTTIQQKPCIFSNVVSTLIYYLVSSSFTDSNEDSLTIQTIDFVSTKTYTDLSEREVPILKIETNGISLWGVNLSCNISSARSNITIGGEKNFFKTRTGIELSSTNGFISFVNITGNIYFTFIGIRCVRGADFFTSVTFNGNTRCCIGFKADKKVDGISIGGMHQTELIPTLYNTSDLAYIIGSHISNYGIVWDVSSNPTKNPHAVEKTILDYEFRLDGSIPTIPRTDDMYAFCKSNYPLAQERDFDFVKRYSEFPNLLDFVLFNTEITRSQFKEFYYTLDDVSVFEHSRVFNTNHLFNKHNLISGTAYAYMRKTPFCFCTELPTEPSTHVLKFFVKIHQYYVSYASRDTGIGAIFSYIIPHMSRGTLNLKISYFNTNGEETEYYKIENQSLNVYYRKEHILNLSEIQKLGDIGIYLEISTTESQFAFPSLFIPYYDGNIEKEFVCSTSKRPRFFDKNLYIGTRCFDVTLGKPIWWNGTNWVDSTGTSV